jgi:hypothetical protein
LLQESLQRAILQIFPDVDSLSAPIAECLARLFNWVGGPLDLDLVMCVLAEFKNEKDPVAKEEPVDSAYSAIDFVADDQPSADQLASLREYLGHLWEEVVMLPTRQAQALLLNLRDNRGRGIIEFLLICGITDAATLSAVLAMSQQDLADIWNELPWEDSRIAAFLDCTTMDVSNLRSVARRRLVRRTEKNENDAQEW